MAAAAAEVEEVDPEVEEVEAVATAEAAADVFDRIGSADEEPPGEEDSGPEPDRSIPPTLPDAVGLIQTPFTYKSGVFWTEVSSVFSSWVARFEVKKFQECKWKKNDQHC